MVTLRVDYISIIIRFNLHFYLFNFSSRIMMFATGDPKEFEASTSSSAEPCRHFEYDEILLATQNFDESLVIGSGGFGKVYKGHIINGSNLVVAAIKRLDSMSTQGAIEFWAEVDMLTKLRHCNLVSLIGYCNYKTEMILVYEYLPNGTLEDHLHKFHTYLSWIQRLNICISAGRGLHYLHTGTGIKSGVIHRDVKSSNILLHETWAAKISDFGLSKIGPTNQPLTYVNTHVKGTFGYFDPNYFATGKLTRKSDVYAFGVVLLEVLCRKRAVDRTLDEEQWGLATWAQESIKEGNLKHIIDSDIRGEISQKCLNEFVRIAERCLHNNPKQRPTMAEVLYSLESVLTVQEKMNKSSQAAGRTIFDKMLHMLPFSSNGKNSVQQESKLSSNSEANNGNNLERAIRNLSPSPSLKVFTFADLNQATRNFSPSLKVFTFADLNMATRNFSLDFLLGQGGFGKVFLGWVKPDTLSPSKRGVGMAVAVKRLDKESLQGHLEWQTEVNLLGNMAHPNIITLLGFCQDEDEHLLVYEYLPNRSFDRQLFTSNYIDALDIAEPLSWETRLKIIIGVARGLIYLHSSKLICRDLKCADILLDEDFNAKLGDFGIVRYGCEIGETHVSTSLMGTFGYLDPTYMATGHLTAKSDIYSFGVVLLESLTGRRTIDSKRPEREQSLVEWAKPIIANRRNINKLMDPRLRQNYPSKGAFKCAELALRCLADKPKDRPSSEEILQSLEQIYALYK